MIPTKIEKLSGPTVVGKIDLPEKKQPKKKKPVASSSDADTDMKRKRKRIKKDISRVDLEENDFARGRKDSKSGKKKVGSLPIMFGTMSRRKPLSISQEA